MNTFLLSHALFYMNTESLCMVKQHILLHQMETFPYQLTLLSNNIHFYLAIPYIYIGPNIHTMLQKMCTFIHLYALFSTNINVSPPILNVYIGSNIHILLQKINIFLNKNTFFSTNIQFSKRIKK